MPASATSLRFWPAHSPFPARNVFLLPPGRGQASSMQSRACSAIQTLSIAGLRGAGALGQSLDAQGVFGESLWFAPAPCWCCRVDREA